MKFIMGKQALTLMELVISITISSMVLLIVMTFITDSIETVISSNQKTEIFDDVFAFKDKFGRYSRGGYLYTTVLIDNDSGTGNDIVLLTDSDSSLGVIFGVVDIDTLQLETNADYKTYKNKAIGYRLLSEDELTAIESVPVSAYNLTFFPDKIFSDLKIKDFQVDLYNSDTIIDMNVEMLLYYNATFDGTLLEGVNVNDLIDINMNF